MKNKGTVTVEASLVLPIFLISMLSVYSMLQSRLADMVVYEAAVETAEYLAEVAYLETGGALLAQAKFEEYVDDRTLLERYVEGVNFRGSVFLTEENQVALQVNYRVRTALPYKLGFSGEKSIVIYRNAYLGDTRLGAGEDEGETYVFVAENGDVYHSERGCSYLRLDKHYTSLEQAKNLGYGPCEYCGKDAGELVIVTGSGERYHSRGNCTGLKRTVQRVKKSSVNLPPCSRCSR